MTIFYYLFLDMNVVPEGGMHFFWNVGMIIDGHTTIEHAIPVAPLYDGSFMFFLFFFSTLLSSPLFPFSHTLLSVGLIIDGNLQKSMLSPLLLFMVLPFSCPKTSSQKRH
jgi:hypothetical protein